MKIIKDYTWGGVVFTSWYILCTAILPNIYIFKSGIAKAMDKRQLAIWFGLTILWQLMIIYSIYHVLINEDKPITDEYKDNMIVYRLFVKGGWENFKRWLATYATNILDDILLLSILFVLPIKIFDKMSGINKVQLIFAKLGLFYVFIFFILGPPTFNIKHRGFEFHYYLQDILGFKNDYNKVGILNYLLINRVRITEIVSSISLLLIVSLYY